MSQFFKNGNDGRNNLSSYFIEVTTVIFLLAIVVIIINFKMLQDGLNGMTDTRWHSMWIHHFSKQLGEGILYPRWLSGVNYGYGNPTFVFYPPLTHYLGSLLKLGGMNLENSLITLFSLSLFLSGFNFYLYSRNRWGKIPGFVGSLGYMTAPYLAFNTYWIASISVAFAIAWVPLGFWLTEQAMINPKWKIPLGLSWTILALTHLPTLLLCGVVWIPYTLLFLLWRPWKIVLANILAISSGLGIASFYLFPAIFEQKFVNIDAQKNVIGGGFQKTMFGLGLPLIPFKLDFFLSHIFWQQFSAIIILFLVAVIVFYNNKIIFKQTKYWVIFSLILAFMMTSWSWPIWSMSSTLQKVQAPWRLLHIFSFAEATLLTIIISGYSRQKLLIKSLILGITVLIIMTNIGYFYKLSRKFPTFKKPGRANLEYLEPARKALFETYTEDLKDVPEYRPLLKNGNPSPEPIPNQPRFSILSGNAVINLLQWKSYERILKLDVKETSTIKIRTYNYPAWHLYINQKLTPIDIANDGTMQFKLSPGIYQVELRYQWTKAMIVGLVFSILSFIFLLFIPSF